MVLKPLLRCSFAAIQAQHHPVGQEVLASRVSRALMLPFKRSCVHDQIVPCT